MIINEQALDAIYTAAKALFAQGGLAAKPLWPDLATKVNSTSREEHYAWLGQFPTLKEWVGDRVVQNMKAFSYTIKNRDFESTVQVARNDIEDDNLGLFGPMFQDMGNAAALHPDQLMFELLASGFTAPCYDGTPFFGEAHRTGKDGSEKTSNCQKAKAGEEKPLWYLLDTSRAIKPFVYQVRRPYDMIAVTDPTARDVFMRNEYLYGVDGRSNMGFGFWQQAFASNLELTPENFNAAYSAMTSLQSDEGRPLGVKPTILLCGMANRENAFYIAKADRQANNVPNPNYQVVDVIVTPHLP
ncbi:Mu-like prophage FluMu major head subunit gpT [Pandoraea anapnoica]|uniref:Mu-like prophage FluMu major head subunit gpT n=1 Tax=Pandoraea anapnoica TaxID=2508301 RepID=A0A5E4ZXD2_9BURK|nr:Mu-like prophage major head subunit gpT family protein [Pandoraea anapnoica]VVE65419.1 Mu-like prophage FluMu major head subunit gpT [Pandoraea anapnoica]VVE65437.1 Mu-like prophage FluMu major head subunit gpT [Pandoraea anapnoica]